MHKPKILPLILFFVLFVPAALYAFSAGIFWIGAAAFVLAMLISISLKIADHWERAIVLRLGKFTGLKGPGAFIIIPFFDSIAYWIDLRIVSTAFSAEKTLTKNTVPVDVEAVLFWKVIDPEKAALEVEDYRNTISMAAQTALIEVIGKSLLSDMLEGRNKLDIELKEIIDKRTDSWGIDVMSVEIRDVLIPSELQDAMSMQAQAEQERQARVILGDSEKQIAEKFNQASLSYQNNPTALHLRAMNMLYEGMKGKSVFVIVPSSVLDTMTLGVKSGPDGLEHKINTMSEKILHELNEKAKAENDIKQE